MAVDFDFDGTFNDDVEENELELDEDQNLDEEPDGDEPSGGRNPFRIILLVLLVIVLACVVCGFGLSSFGDRLPFPLPPPFGDRNPTATPPPAIDTPTLAPTDVGEVPPEETEEPVPGTEQPTEAPPTEEPPTGEVTPTDDSQLPPTDEPTGEPTDEPTGEPTDEPTDEPPDEHDGDLPTVTPVPGPTSTPGPTVVVTVDSCDNNTPPTAEANGPYTAMMGKGMAFVTFDGSGSTDSDGMIESYEWDFGDGSAAEMGQSVTHGYSALGSYVANLTVTDNCGASSQDTADVTIVGPTPPSAREGTPSGATTPQSAPASATMGFCYRVQAGDTLSRLAGRFGVSLADLAAINQVSRNYFVIAGQGLFIPTDQINGEPNAYRVQPDDTLSSVAFQCGVTSGALAASNGLAADARLTPGQNLIVPPWRQVNP